MFADELHAAFSSGWHVLHQTIVQLQNVHQLGELFVAIAHNLLKAGVLDGRGGESGIGIGAFALSICTRVAGLRVV